MINVYKVIDGKIESKQIKKSQLKYHSGWKQDIDEALLNKISLSNYTLANEIYSLINYTNEYLAVREMLKDLDIKTDGIKEQNSHGMSLENINQLVNNLIKLCDID